MREKNKRKIILYAANENKCHQKAVIVLQRNISSICKQHVSRRFIELDAVYRKKKIKVPSNTLFVIILSKSLLKCLQRSEDLTVKKTSEIIFVNLLENCEINPKMSLSKIMRHQDNITMFHLPKDTVMFYHFISTRLRQTKNKRDPHIAEKGPKSEETLSQLNRSRQIINHSAPRFVPEKPRPSAPSNQSFDSISQVIAINKRRKYRCTKRMLGFQLTSNGSEHIVLPGHFTYTKDDTAPGYSYEGLMFSSADETDCDVKQRLWHDTSPKYNTRSADPRRFSQLSDNGLMSDEMEAVSIGGKSV